jgi:hypothetical protein
MRIPTVKINGTAVNPRLWPDGSFSVQGAAAAIGITPRSYSIGSEEGAGTCPIASDPSAYSDFAAVYSGHNLVL